MSAQDLSGDESVTKSWNRQPLLICLPRYLHVSPCRPCHPASWVTTGHWCPSLQTLAGRGHLRRIDVGIRCPGWCRIGAISPPPSPLHLHHCCYWVPLPLMQHRLHRQSKRPDPNPTATRCCNPTAMTRPTSDDVPPLQQCPHQLPSPSAITPDVLTDAFPPGLVVPLSPGGRGREG